MNDITAINDKNEKALKNFKTFDSESESHSGSDMDSNPLSSITETMSFFSNFRFSGSWKSNRESTWNNQSEIDNSPFFFNRNQSDIADESNHSPHWLWKCWNKFTRRHHVTLLFFCIIIIWPLGIYSLPRLMRNADSTFTALSGTPSADALLDYHNAYNPSSSNISDASNSPHFKPIMVLFQLDNFNSSKKSSTSLIDGTSIYFNQTQAFVFQYCQYIQSQLTTSDTVESSIEIESFYHLYAEFPILAKQAFASPNGNIVLIKINPPQSLLESKTKLLNFLQKITSYPDMVSGGVINGHVNLNKNKIHSLPPLVSISFTGIPLFQQDMIISSKNDVSRLDTISLPISLLILAWVLQSSVVLLILPIMTIGTTICLWSTILYSLMCITNIAIAQFTPSIMMSLTIAMSVDYSLFYLSRCLEEIQQFKSSDFQANDNIHDIEYDGEEIRDVRTNITYSKKEIVYNANLNALSNAGHSILVSGSTLAMCLFGLVILPLNLMVSTGIGSCIAVLSCIFVNLTILPTILHTKVGRYLIFFKGFQIPKYRLKSRYISLEKVRTVCNLHYWRSRCSNNHESSIDGNDVDDSPLLHDSYDTEILLSEKPGNLSETHKLDHQIKQNEMNSMKSESYPSIQYTDQHLQDENPNSSSEPSASIWMRLGLFALLRRKLSIAILVVLLVFFILPISSFLFKIKTSIAMELMLPYDSPSLSAYRVLGDAFGKGALSPYQIIFDGRKANKTIDSREGFHFMNSVLSNLTNQDVKQTKIYSGQLDSLSHEDDIGFDAAVYNNNISWDKQSLDAVIIDLIHSNKSDQIWTRLDLSGVTQRKEIEREGRNNHVSLRGFPATPTLSSFTGISILNGTFIPFPIYEAAIYCEQIASDLSTVCPIPALRALALISNKTCSQNHQATSVTAILEVDPFTPAGIQWLNDARALLNSITSDEELFDVYIIGGAAIEYDAINAIFAAFPKMIGLTTFIVFIFMGVSFRSVGAPIRSVLSIGATLSFVYGLVVLVYQYGVFDWTNLRCISSVGALSFLPPIMGFTVVVGLGLDYDVFLTTRILEYRMMGYNNTSSIILGLDKTGRIITAAGIIMCAAFGGMLFSSTIVLNQFAFFLVSAVLLDTFVIRTLLVPIVLELSGEKWGWWPRKFPVGLYSALPSFPISSH